MPLPLGAMGKLEDQRNALIHFLESSRPQGSFKNKVTVVFDGQRGVIGSPSSSPIAIIFSKGGSADDKIKALVSQTANKKNMVVVTNDRELQYAVRALGAKVEGVQEFLTTKKLQRPKEQAKYISKNLESKITSELEGIWLKKREKK